MTDQINSLATKIAKHGANAKLAEICKRLTAQTMEVQAGIAYGADRNDSWLLYDFTVDQLMQVRDFIKSFSEYPDCE